ncbi:UvrD-helicase domain-containing protein [Microbacterium sp. GXF7504]
MTLDTVLTRTIPVVSAAALAAALGQFPPTPEQAAVIEAPFAPALVVAGAGSGKTETMAGRVVWLVANGFVRRDEVLGLTFTRKAAGELAERVRRRLARLGELERAGLLPVLDELHAGGALQVFVQAERAGEDEARRRALDALARRFPAPPADAAAVEADALLDRPNIATYNGFADAIVREHAVRLGRDPEAAVLSESAAWLLMRRVVLESDDPRLEERTESVRSIVDAALRIARDGVDNLVDLDALAAFGERFQRVRDVPSENKRTVVYKDVATAADRLAALPLLTDLAREYAARKDRLAVLDFSDQVAGALAAVRADPAVRADLRERYRVVLLDEYQDTSVVQTDLLAEVFADTAVMAVGDPHQSIYGWRGASAGNLGDFPRAFAPNSDCGTYSLLTSWRNAARVLVAANAVLGPLAATAPVRVGELRPRPDAPEGLVEVAVASDVDAEADRVADWFAQVRAERAAAGQPTTGAVLFRSKRHMVRFADALGRRGIPHRILGLGGLLATPEVVDVVSALRVIADPTAGSALIRLLAGPRWSIGLADLGALARLARRTGQEAEGASLSDALELVLRRSDDSASLADFSSEGLTRLREAAAVFAGLRRAAGLAIPELIRLVENELRLDVELAANETRGPARIASAQLRAFMDEVHAFLAADERGTLPSLLAWLDHAEKLDEFAPRTEPPEDDVVQLLTIHGSKGLEWDAVAVVRMVEDELPTAPRDSKGWLAFGVLPSPFRGDAAWLPEFAWEQATTQQELKRAMEDFVEANRARTREEDRRLAYVAVTRARDRLLLTASPWAGGRSARTPSRFLRDMTDALGIALPDDDPGENPFDGARRMLEWPMDPLGGRRARVEAAAEAVRAAQAAPPAEPDRDLALLLAERDAQRAGVAGTAPTRIPASQFKDFVADFDDAVARRARPLPEKPYRQTRLGTLFHAWVEERSGVAAGHAGLDDTLWDDEDAPLGADAVGADELEALARLQRTFIASEWGGLAPIEVETEIDFRHVGPDGREHVVICKLDAVYARGDRIEIVDWKTGRSPRNDAERAERMVQLDLYRQAYHQRHGVPLHSIDVALYYVAEDLVIRA